MRSASELSWRPWPGRRTKQRRFCAATAALALIAACFAGPERCAPRIPPPPAAADQSATPPDWRLLTAWSDVQSDHRLSLFLTGDGGIAVEIGPRDALMVAASGPSPEPIPVLGVVISYRGKVLDSFGPDAPGGMAHRVYRSPLAASHPRSFVSTPTATAAGDRRS